MVSYKLFPSLSPLSCDHVHINKNSNNNTKQNEPLDQADKKSESEEIIDQSHPNTLPKKGLAQLKLEIQ